MHQACRTACIRHGDLRSSPLPYCLCEEQVRPSASPSDRSPPPPSSVLNVLPWELERATVYPGKTCQLCMLGVHMYSSVLWGHTTVHRCVSYTNLNADGAYGLVTHCIAALYALLQYVSLCSSAIALIFVKRSNVFGEDKTKNWMTSVHNTKNSCSDIRSRWNFWLAHRYSRIWVWWGSTVLAAFQLRWWWEGRKWFPALLWQIVLITEDVAVIEGFKQKKACASWNKPVFFLFFLFLKKWIFLPEVNNLVVSKAFLLKRTIVWESTCCLSSFLEKNKTASYTSTLNHLFYLKVPLPGESEAVPLLAIHFKAGFSLHSSTT